MNWDCGQTRTALTGGYGFLDADEAVKGMLKHLGKTRQTHGHLRHDFSLIYRELIPKSILPKMAYDFCQKRKEEVMKSK